MHSLGDSPDEIITLEPDDKKAPYSIVQRYKTTFFAEYTLILSSTTIEHWLSWNANMCAHPLNHNVAFKKTKTKKTPSHLLGNIHPSAACYSTVKHLRCFFLSKNRCTLFKSVITVCMFDLYEENSRSCHPLCNNRTRKSYNDILLLYRVLLTNLKALLKMLSQNTVQ